MALALALARGWSETLSGLQFLASDNSCNVFSTLNLHLVLAGLVTSAVDMQPERTQHHTWRGRFQSQSSMLPPFESYDEGQLLHWQVWAGVRAPSQTLPTLQSRANWGHSNKPPNRWGHILLECCTDNPWVERQCSSCASSVCSPVHNGTHASVRNVCLLRCMY